MSWENTSHGGDWFTLKGDAMLSPAAPQADGSFVAFGYGRATVTYHPGNSCQVTNGDTFEAGYMVTMQSADGRSATIDFGSDDEAHTFDLLCPARIPGRNANAPRRVRTHSDYDPPGVPTVTVPLREGATPYSKEFQSDRGRRTAGDAGTVTLHYCTQQQSNEKID